MNKRDLERKMIPCHEADIPISAIDTETGGQHGLQNREQVAPPDDVIEDYTAGWRRDDDIPPVILWQLPEQPGRYIPIDGYTRTIAAERAGRDTIPAIIAECAKEIAVQLSYEANAYHGRPASREFRLASAVKLTEMGVTIKDAAARLNLPVDVVTDQRTVIKTRARLLRLDVKGTHNLSDHMIRRLAPIELDAAFKGAAELARDAKGTLTSARTEALVREIRGARSEADQMAIIDGERSELGAAKMDDASAKTAAKMSRLNRQVTSLRQIDLSEAVKAAMQAGWPVSDVKDVLSRLNEVAAGLAAVINDIYGDA